MRVWLYEWMADRCDGCGFMKSGWWIGVRGVALWRVDGGW